MSADRDARVENLRKSNERRAVEAVTRVRDATHQLVEAGDRVNVHAVATKAGVARSFIYSHSDLLAFVRQFADTSRRLHTPRADSRGSDASLRSRLVDSLDRLQQLGDELATMKAERETLLSEIRSLRSENRRLQAKT